MVLQANLRILKQYFPETWERIMEIGGTPDRNQVRAVTTKQGHTTLKVGKKYLHRRNEPFQEAIELIEQFGNVKEHSDILFYGVGLGYHIFAFMEKYPDTPFSIYEPVPEVFYRFLNHVDLKKIPLHLLKRIYLETEAGDVTRFCREIVSKVRSSILVIDLPAYHKVFPEKCQRFFSSFETVLEERRLSLATVSAFEKRWTINGTKNLIHLLTSPNILLEKKGAFTNLPALLVASGPSLEDEIDNLREIKEHGLAYIFSVGSAINTLVKHGIYPDASCTYDPTEENQIVTREVLAKGVNSIPLIFGSTVGYETLELYPGPKLHMIISHDTVANHYLKPTDGREHEFIHDATTVAVITLQLLHKLGFNPIILVGQNLAYLEQRYYASGSTYHPLEVGEQELARAIPVKSVHGDEVLSNQTFIRMRQQIEAYLDLYRDLEVINATRRGAHIEGTRFQSLDTLLKDRLHRRVVESNWLEVATLSYDMEHLNEQRRLMNIASSRVPSALERCQQRLNNIVELANSQDAARINHSYDQFNLSMDELRNNLFFSTFIAPMTRVEFEFLILAVPAISETKDPVPRAQMMEKEFRPYLSACEQALRTITPLYQQLDRSIKDFHQLHSIRQKAAGVKILLVECDGVLTDGAIYYSSSGEEFRKFSARDRAGVRHLQGKGIRTLLIAPESNPVIRRAAEAMGISAVYSGVNKQEIITAILNQYRPEEIACIFSNISDITDLSWLKLVSAIFTVKNAPKPLKNHVDYILPVKGGQGAILEVAKLLTGQGFTG